MGKAFTFSHLFVILAISNLKHIVMKRNYSLEDVTQMPAVPTEMSREDLNRHDYWDFEPGWYGLRITPQGQQILSPVANVFDSYDECEKTCTVHNQWLGMSVIEIVQLYQSLRFQSAVLI